MQRKVSHQLFFLSHDYSLLCRYYVIWLLSSHQTDCVTESTQRGTHATSTTYYTYALAGRRVSRVSSPPNFATHFNAEGLVGAGRRSAWRGATTQTTGSTFFFAEAWSVEGKNGQRERESSEKGLKEGRKTFRVRHRDVSLLNRYLASTHILIHMYLIYNLD